MIAGLELKSDARVLSSLESSEDAGVFLIDESRAIVQTLDFITPIVDDPFIFGAIAAANSLSDVFAMGGEVLTAMNIISFDSGHFDNDVFREILAGGASKVAESGAALVGGHSVSGSELFYGLSVTGVVHPKKFWANNTASAGELLILTKPLGSGVLSTALKCGELSDDLRDEMIEQMCTLNLRAMRALRHFDVRAATDITGFGLLGHMSEMLNENISFELSLKSVPLMRGVSDKIAQGFVPGGTGANEGFASVFVENASGSNITALYDAQTSGGLLLSLPSAQAWQALRALKDAGCEHASIIAEVLPKSKNKPIKII